MTEMIRPWSRAAGAAVPLVVLIVTFAAAGECSPAARGAVACAAPAAADAGAEMVSAGGNAAAVSY